MEKIKINRIGRNTLIMNYKKEKIKLDTKEYEEILEETKSLIKDFNEDFFINWEE